MSKQGEKRWHLDREIEDLTEKRITASRLRKDRLGKQIFPFHRIGRSVYYDLAEIDALIEGSRFGGNVGSNAHKKQAV